MQGLGGTNSGLNRGASMSGNRANGSLDELPIKFMGNTGPWTCAQSGQYLVVMQCAGAPGNSGSSQYGGGGALVGAYKHFNFGDSLSWTRDVLTFPDGSTMGQSAPSTGTPGSGGVAYGGDFMANGTPSVGTTAGQSGVYGPFEASALPSSAAPIRAPGPGGGGSGLATTIQTLGPQLVTVVRIGD